jgi:hypothetical protein
MRVPKALVLVVVALAGAGCGKSTHPVRGKVRFSDGTPLTVGRVVADSGDPQVGSWGYIREDGTFELGTFSHNDGVPPGTYRVSIENAVTSPPPGGDPTKFVSRPLLHPRFADKGTSGLTFEVPKDTVWEIVVEKP